MSARPPGPPTRGERIAYWLLLAAVLVLVVFPLVLWGTTS